MSSPRKRTAADADLDPNTYIERYLSKRNIRKTTSYANSEAQRAVLQRAAEARESYKRMRTRVTAAAAAAAADISTDAAPALSAADKYNRRLENNRKSAAASRVFIEVHKYETAYTLNQVVARCKQLEEESVRHKNRADTLAKDNSRFCAEIAALRSMLPTDQLAPVLHSIPAADAHAPVQVQEQDAECSYREVQRIREHSAALRERHDAALHFAAAHPAAADDLSQLPVLSDTLPVPALSDALSAPAIASRALFRSLRVSPCASPLRSQRDAAHADEPPIRRLPVDAVLRIGALNSQEPPVNLRPSMDFDAAQAAAPPAVLCSQELPTPRAALGDDLTNENYFFDLPAVSPRHPYSLVGVAAT